MPADSSPADAPLRVLIVDDEELARRGVRSRLRQLEGIAIVGECASGREAIQAIRDADPDLVFLDVQMPGLDGFSVVEAIGPDQMPAVVFVTAYDQHALRAFQAQALDYLLKPIDEERFRQAVDRVRGQVRRRKESELGRRLQALVADMGGSERPSSVDEAPLAPKQRFVIKTGARIRFVEASEIVWVEAAGDYVKLHTAAGAFLLRETMAGMDEQLDAMRFLRIHRSTIVNTEHIDELRVDGSAYSIVLDDGGVHKVSRGYREALSAFFDGAL